jgi:hypothetical protein
MAMVVKKRYLCDDISYCGLVRASMARQSIELALLFAIFVLNEDL